MAVNVPGVPSNIRVPLFYAAVDPTRANTLDQPHVALLIGQITPSGSLNPPAPVSGTTSAATASGSATLTFTAAPAGIAVGDVVTDQTAPAVIPAATTVIAVGATTVTMSANATGAGVGLGDTIRFTRPFTPAATLAASQSDVDGKCGVGSLLGQLYRYFRKQNLTSTVYLLPLQDDAAAVKATGYIDISGTPTASGTIALYVDGIAVPVLVTTTMTATEIATAIAAAINADSDLFVTATAAQSRVTVTAKNAGTAGNDSDLRTNYFGTANGEATPAGITVLITPMAGGTTNPATGLTAALALLPDTAYDYVGHPYSDAGCLNALQTFFSDASGTWSPTKELFGGGFTAARGTLSALQTLGLARNDQHMSILGAYDSPSPPYAWAGAYCGLAARELAVDPAVPFREVTLVGILPPPVKSQFQFSDQNTLLWSGIATAKVVGGNVVLQRAITTYQLNTFGPDDSMIEVEQMFTLAEVIRLLRGRVESQWPRAKLADDGIRFGPGQNVVTPKVIAADLVAYYDSVLVQQHVWCQDTAAFSAGLVVERDANDPGRVNVLWDGVMIDRLNVFALLAQFRQTA